MLFGTVVALRRYCGGGVGARCCLGCEEDVGRVVVAVGFLGGLSSSIISIAGVLLLVGCTIFSAAAASLFLVAAAAAAVLIFYGTSR